MAEQSMGIDMTTTNSNADTLVETGMYITRNMQGMLDIMILAAKSGEIWPESLTAALNLLHDETKNLEDSLRLALKEIAKVDPPRPVTMEAFMEKRRKAGVA